MKKLLTLTLLLVACLAAKADDTRKVWNFTKGFSETTLANLKADASSASPRWTDVSSKGYYESLAWSKTGELWCTVDGEEWKIPETEGLTFYAVSKQHLCIEFKTDATLPPHVWLNGKKAEDAVTIPGVPAGEKVHIVYGSHKDTESRGFSIKTNGFKGEDGTTTTFKTKDIDTAVVVNNNDAESDLKIQATSGMHIYCISIGDLPQEEVEPVNIAYVYDTSNGFNFDNDDISGYLGAWASDTYGSDVNFATLDAAGDLSLVTRDSLASYDLVVLNGSISPSNAFVSTLKEAIAFVPIINVSPTLYSAWGYGTPTATTTATLTAGEKAAKASLFKSSVNESGSLLDDNNQLTLLTSGTIEGYTAEAGTYFANDSVWATADGVNAIHVHNANRNTYILLPLGLNSALSSDNAPELIANAASMAINSKADLANATKASIGETYHNLYTTVTLKHAVTGAAIYYTLDGSDPTTESTRYVEPFDINTKDVTVKALAIADGYLPSEIAEKTITICELAKSPVISVDKQEGQSVVTITPANDGDEVMFNYTGNQSSDKSQAYTGPITVTRHTTITAFTLAHDNYLQSETVQQDVEVTGEKVRIDVVSQFDANKAEWSLDGSSPYYYIGKNGYAYYTDEIVSTTTDEDGNTVNTYAPADSLTTINPGKGWELKTYGQVVTWESNSLGHSVGDPNAYNPATAYDDGEELASNCHLTFGKVSTNADGLSDPVSASLQTTEAIQGPFDIVAIFGGKGSKLQASVTTDTLSAEWTPVDTIYAPNVSEDTKGRLYARSIVSYEGTEKVFVKLSALNTSGRLFNVIIKNEGEKSKEYTGIETIGTEPEGRPISTRIYTLGGTLVGKAKQGIQIVKETYANGAVKTRKVVVK